MQFTLIGGPCDGWRISGQHRRGNEIHFLVGQTTPVAIFGPIQPAPIPREAVYRITSDEDGTATWLGWQDELILQPSPLVDAMANASNDEIIALLDAVSEASRKRPNIS